jgi:hypothetical protein
MRIIYRGTRDWQGIEVRANSQPLLPRFDLKIYSRRPFNWGSDLAGSNQLALALLAHAINDETAIAAHQHFAADVVTQIATDQWSIEQETIINWYNHCLTQPLLVKGKSNG